MAKKTFGLGRGLEALIDTTQVNTAGAASINEVEISKIVANPLQPRKNFDEEALQELATSIRELGVISPITLRENEDGTYMIIAGERRFRASKIAGLETIPAYIRKAADEHVMEMALVENVQREDLDAIEIALAYQRLLEEYNLTQERLSERVGKKRATIANYLRLLRLPAEIQMGIQNKLIDMGHARAILSAKSATDQLKLYKHTIAEGLSVRGVEELASRLENDHAKPETREKTAVTPKLPELRALEHELTRFFATKVKMSCNEKGKGKIVISFNDDNELTHIMEKLDTRRD